MLVRPLAPADKADWLALWRGYLAFYRAIDLPDAITERTWERFHDPAEPLFALVAEENGRLEGFAHHLFHRSTWAERHYCYLEDLYTAPEARGRGMGRALIEATAEAARRAGSSKVYWLTHETNVAGQMLYDKVARKSGFIHYER